MSAATDTMLRAEDIPVGEARVIGIDGVEVAVFRTRAGKLFALGARCPHKGGPLADGLCDETQVVCPLHGRSFALETGAEVDGELAVAAWEATVQPPVPVQVTPRR